MISTMEQPQDPTDPYARAGQTFPVLLTIRMSRVAAYGSEEQLPTGASLFERGQRGVDFFLVLSGGIEIIDKDSHGVSSVRRCTANGSSPARWICSTIVKSFVSAAPAA